MGTSNVHTSVIMSGMCTYFVLTLCWSQFVFHCSVVYQKPTLYTSYYVHICMGWCGSIRSVERDWLVLHPNSTKLSQSVEQKEQQKHSHILIIKTSSSQNYWKNKVRMIPSYYHPTITEMIACNIGMLFNNMLLLSLNTLTKTTRTYPVIMNC